ncbi:MAG: hypothetical protein K1X83_04565 [Oligoflexia bacterium]|nr:hypothetical protein [Oligoflexia bacterium]
MNPDVAQHNPTLVNQAAQSAECEGLLTLLNRADQLGQHYPDLRHSIEGLATDRPIDIGIRGRQLGTLYQEVLAKDDAALGELASACASLSHSYHWSSLSLSHC